MRGPDKSNKRAWWCRRSRLARDLIRDEAGGVLLYMTILIPVMMGIIGLALDASRLFLLNTEQRDLADAAALAAAGELDRTSAGIDAAVDAAHNLVTNDPAWANDAEPEFHISSVLFCPDQTCAPEDTRMNVAEAKANPGEARFVMTTAELRLVYPSFLVFIDAVSPAYSNAIAIAGSSMVACNVTPMMMCNTFNEADFTEGVMFELKGDNKLGPGAFSLVDPAGMTSSGADLTRELLASTNPNFCYVNEISLATGGRTSSIQQGLNIRFDLYPNGATGDDLAAYPPAPNVTKGQVYSPPSGGSGNCNFSDAAGPNQLVPFPLDDCFSVTDTTDPDYCTTYVDTNSRIGDGTWAREAYWTANHAGAGHAKPAGWDTITRYEAYLWELGVVDGEPYFTNMPNHADAVENPLPQCHAVKATANSLPTDFGDIDRRTLYVAVADCTGITGNSTPDLESARYGEFFLVRPSESGEVLAEFVRWIEPDDKTGILRRIIQLYR